MKDLLDDIAGWSEGPEAIALATLVRVRGSAPRRSGARLVVARGGRISGSVSGGCVEGDVVARAMQVLDSGRPALASYRISDELGFEVGLSCGGSIEVLIEPLPTDPAWSALCAAVRAGRSAALALAVGPAALLGRRLFVQANGDRAGSIDPALDSKLIEVAVGLLPRGGAQVISMAWRSEQARVFVDSHPPPLRLVIVGATHVGVELSRLASGLGFRVIVVDPREAFATEERFPDVCELIRAWPEQALAGVELDEFSYLVTLSHDPKFDLPALGCALRSRARYIGALGSRTTCERRVERLRAQGFGDADLVRIRAPIGLDIGGRTPSEIALSILAEMLAVRSQRAGRPLSEGSGSIHGDR